eukprot:scaffold426_cov219-Amphora_coffeaeformis.AAC.24
MRHEVFQRRHVVLEEPAQDCLARCVAEIKLFRIHMLEISTEKHPILREKVYESREAIHPPPSTLFLADMQFHELYAKAISVLRPDSVQTNATFVEIDIRFVGNQNMSPRFGCDTNLPNDNLRRRPFPNPKENHERGPHGPTLPVPNAIL